MNGGLFSSATARAGMMSERFFCMEKTAHKKSHAEPKNPAWLFFLFVCTRT
jgi:hypothetical protein